ncbi:hypothetical protein [Trabulsiella odontotermitis]|uniref:hypothetical protein n=1 Tax=Trabulsiella odontotermitis TaxID=379893 RepID=UPI000675E5C8|nr:hypothetical protein [Trabulsiella odontotermitis]
MLIVFTVLALSLLFAYFGRKMVATLLIIICLALSVKQFLWDIYSPEDGFRMPWLQVKVIAPFQQQYPGFDVPEWITHGDIA